MMECIFVYKTKLQKCLLTVLMLLYIVVNCGRITLFVVVLVFFGHFDTENAFLYQDKDSRIFQRSFIVPIFFFFQFFFLFFPYFFLFSLSLLSVFFLCFLSFFIFLLLFFFYLALFLNFSFIISFFPSTFFLLLSSIQDLYFLLQQHPYNNKTYT